MKAKKLSVETRTFEGKTFEIWTVCVEKVHVRWQYEIFERNGRKTRKLNRQSLYKLDERCDCFWDERVICQTQPRLLEFEIFDDGDSGEQLVCFAGLHFHFCCMEFGTEWTSESHEPCDCLRNRSLKILVPRPFTQEIQTLIQRR